MLTDVSLIKGLGVVLHKNGFDVYYYDEKEEYTDKLVKDADLILVVPYEAGNKFGNAGKGQYNEIQLAKRLNIPVYFTCLFHHGDISKNIAMYDIHEAMILDVNSWKKNYGCFGTSILNYSLYTWLQTMFNPVTKIVNDLLLIIDITE